MWILLILACDQGTSVGGVGIDEPVQPVETGGPDSGEGNLEVTVHLTRYEGEVGCAAAGVTALTLSFRDSEITLPCEDARLSWRGVPAGSGELTVRGETERGPFYAGSTPIALTDGGSADVDVVIVCDDNGWEDGCGGA